MSDQAQMPDGFVLARTTDAFDKGTVPSGLLRAHRVADGVWARLVVHTGSVGFVFEDEPDDIKVVPAGDSLVIPPARLHHVEPDGPATFAVEFHRPPADKGSGLESTGLEPPSADSSH